MTHCDTNLSFSLSIYPRPLCTALPVLTDALPSCVHLLSPQAPDHGTTKQRHARHSGIERAVRPRATTPGMRALDKSGRVRGVTSSPLMNAAITTESLSRRGSSAVRNSRKIRKIRII